jgi:hypothetical protein
MVVLWAQAFALTVVLEAPLVVWLFRGDEPSLQRRLVLLLFANLVTHPAVWFIFPALELGRLAMLACAETWAVVLEGWFYATVFRAGLLRAMGVSALANGFSFGVGLLLFR